MERSWSQAGATGGNRSQTRPPRKRLKSAVPQPLATGRNGSAAHGNEGVVLGSELTTTTCRQTCARTLDLYDRGRGVALRWWGAEGARCLSGAWGLGDALLRLARQALRGRP